MAFRTSSTKMASDLGVEMKKVHGNGNWSSANLVEDGVYGTPPKIPIWRRYIDSFKPMKHAHTDAPMAGKDGGDEASYQPPPEHLKRTLKNRHIQMIAFGGAIGTGLFIGSGGVLHSGGPASLIIGFILIGTMLFNVVMALGEMAVLYPIAGSFSIYSSRFIDPAWGFAMGWNYALQWLVVLPLELTAAAITIRFWGDPVDPGVWVALFLLVVIIINFFGVKGYGEAEFVFSMVKITAVVGFIILGVVIVVGGAPAGKYLGTKTWIDPGAFHNGFQGFCSVFVTAAFAFGGTEMVGLAAAESANPRKSLPKATKQVFWRISIFYIVTLFLIGLIVPYNHPRLLGGHDATASPFVIAIQDAGINILASIFNGVILISVLSVGNSAVYGSSRTLCAMAQTGQAPKFLGYIDREGRPLFAIILALLLGLLAFLIEAKSKELIFNWLLAISGLSTIFTWMSICWAHIRFRSAWKAQGHTLDEMPFRAAFGVIGSWYGLILNVLILIAQFYVAVDPVSEPSDPLPANSTLTTTTESPSQIAGDRTSDFFQAYLAAPIVVLFYVFWKLYKRTPFMVCGKGQTSRCFLLNTETMDLLTGRRELDLAEILVKERAEHAALPAYKRFYHSLCG